MTEGKEGNAAQFIRDLREDTLREVEATKSQLRDIWSSPLAERMKKGHSLGPLKVISQKKSLLVLAHQTELSRESFSRLRQGDLVRITHDDPLKNGPSAYFIEDDGDEIQLELLQLSLIHI